MRKRPRFYMEPSARKRRAPLFRLLSPHHPFVLPGFRPPDQGQTQNHTRAEVLASLAKCAALAASRGAEVTVGFEDASHASPDQLKEAARAARQCGVVRVRLSDTVGCYTPDKVWRAVRMLREAGVDVEIHAHNDFGSRGRTRSWPSTPGRVTSTQPCGVLVKERATAGWLPLRRQRRGWQHIVRGGCPQGP